MIPEVLVDADPGEILTEVNIGNQVHPTTCDVSSAGAAVVVAVKHLKVRNIILCGHYRCEGVSAVLYGLEKFKPNISNWMSHAQSIVEKTRSLEREWPARWNAAVEENVRLQLANLQTFACVQEGVSAKTLQIQGWIYDLRDAIRILNPESNKFEEVR